MRCLQATQAISKQLEHSLDLRSQAALRVHLLTCSHCRQFKRNCERLRILMREFRQAK